MTPKKRYERSNKPHHIEILEVGNLESITSNIEKSNLRATKQPTLKRTSTLV